MENDPRARPDEPTAARRQRNDARRLQVLLGISLALGVAFTLRHAPFGRLRTTVIAVLTVTAIWLTRRWAAARAERTTTAAHLMNVFGVGSVTAVALVTGQSTSIAVPFLVLAPLLAVYQLDSRATIVWGVIAAAMLMLVHASELLVVIPPELELRGVERLPALVALCAVVVALGLASKRSTESHVEEIESHERLLALQAEEIGRARDDALAAGRAKSDFLANMSHEVRTPLNGILGTAELLLDGPLLDEQRSLLETVRGSGHALLAMLNDALDLSRLDAGRMPIDDRPFDPKRVVSAVRDLFGPEVQRKRLTFELVVSPEVPAWVRGDETRVRQVVVNLVSNAVKFTVEGGVRVDVTTASEGEVVFTVRDSGPGIALEDHTRVFETFTQLDGSSTRRHGGSGLGLAISKGLIERMGGRIEVRSTVGEGAEFRVALPLPACDAPPPRPSQLPGAKPFDRALGARQPLRILVAEDNATNREVLSLMLEHFGYSPVMVEDGLVAVERAGREGFDLVLMDLHMPRMDGLEAARRILEARPPGRRPRIVALTADVRAEQKEACLAAGMAGFLAKPIRVSDLEKVLRENEKVVKGAPPPATPGPSSSEAALERLRLLCENRPGAFERLVAQHLAESRALVDAMKDSARREDAKGLRAAAHRLKSSTALFGEEEMSRYAAQIEALDPGAGADTITRLLDALDRATIDSAERLSSERAEPSAHA